MKRPIPCRTLEQVQTAFRNSDVRKFWVVRVEEGSCRLHYIGPNPEGMEPMEPLELDLATGSRLLAEALNLAGIPAERG